MISTKASHCNCAILQCGDLSCAMCYEEEDGRGWEGCVVELFSRSTLPRSRGQPLGAWRLSRATQGRRSYSGSLGAKHTLCTAGPHQPRPEGTQLSRTWRTGAENFQALHCEGRLSREGNFPNCLSCSGAVVTISVYDVCYEEKYMDTIDRYLFSGLIQRFEDF